jgi:hypothetical protein
MSISPEQVYRLPSFAQTFLALFRERASFSRGREELRGDDLWLVIPARDQAVGDLEILVDASEVTVYVGHHTHCHFSSYDGDGPAEDLATCKQAADYLDDVLADRVVIWSVRRPDGKRGSGGTYSLGGTPRFVDARSDAFLWSGKRVDVSSHGGA